jgi:hypothetical protein
MEMAPTRTGAAGAGAQGGGGGGGGPGDEPIVVAPTEQVMNPMFLNAASAATEGPSLGTGAKVHTFISLEPSKRIRQVLDAGTRCHYGG